MVREPWFERRGLITHRVINPRGWILQIVTTIVFAGFAIAWMYLERSHPYLSLAFATAAVLSGAIGLVVMALHTTEREWRK